MNHKLTSTRISTFMQAAVAASFICFAFAGAAQETKLDIQAVTRDTQKTSHEEHGMTLVWWIPEDFWRASFSSNPDMTPAAIERFLKTVHPYTLVAVVKMTIGPFGGVTYEREQTIRSEVVIADSGGKQYKPMDETDLGPDIQNLLLTMKPLLGNMMGAMGKNLDFYVFPGKGSDGKAIANPKNDGSFTVQLGEQNFRWRLPLGSLLPPKVCPQCSEKFSGDFKYCPYDGTALKVAR